MTISNITKKVEKLGNAWEEFKSINDRRLKEIERKGSADGLTIDHLNRLNNVIDDYKSRVENVEIAMNRQVLSGFETKNFNDNISREVKNNDDVIEHKNAFISYIRKGLEGDLSFLEKKALSASNDADGGYLITSQMSEKISKYIFETSPMRNLASITNVSTDSLDIIEDNDEAGAGWSASETAEVSDSDTPQINKITISVNELVAQPKATQKLIDDAAIDVEKWLVDKLTEVFSRKENSAFISGDGTGKPKGILSYQAGTSAGQIQQLVSGVNGGITADSLIKLYYALKDEYSVNATFLMNRATIQAVRLLKDSQTDQYLWQPSLQLGNPDTLLGTPVKSAVDMPSISNNALAVAIGDFRRAYQIVDRTGIRILRDPYTEKPYVKFYTTKRVGGAVINFDAIKLLKLSES